MSKLKVKYKYEEDYNPIYANGAYGGITPLGEIVINFYLERMPLPIEHIEEITVVNNQVSKTLSSTIPEDLNSTVIRYVSGGVVLSLQSAIEVHNWLAAHIDALKSMEKQKSKQSS